MKRLHKMPFGAECREDGRVRFSLWAPAADQVDLVLAEANQAGANRAGANREQTVPLERRDQGWFEAVTAAKPGDRYSFRINQGQTVPDPASRFQPNDVHQPSEIIDPESFDWQDQNWRGRPWEEAVIYELHVGTFSEQGTFAGVEARLDYLAELGVTAIELMPVADFPGKRNWGYDGVFHFAPDSTYGRPEDLKRLVQSAHQRGLMVLLDVVYNHFGPEGNYLNLYARQFFTDRHKTPWGDSINFDGPQSRAVRDFFINNAIYWLSEYHFDGLRLDAVHAIPDNSNPDILTEIAQSVRAAVDPERHVHLILENDSNQPRYLQRKSGDKQTCGDGRPRPSTSESAKEKSPKSTEDQCQPETYTAQWNDDIHHALHVLITGERDGYYKDYAVSPIAQLGRCLTEGFAYQGEASAHRDGALRGEATKGVPPAAFVSFLQNHDQIGNRAFGERITKIADRNAIRAALAVMLLAPSPPMLFMGEEFAAESPFLFFCDFEKDLAAAVTNGRRNEFAHFSAFSDPAARERIPDPGAASTFTKSRLTWKALDDRNHQSWLAFYRSLLKIRREKIVPLIKSGCHVDGEYKIIGNSGIAATWRFAGSQKLSVAANLGNRPVSGFSLPDASPFYKTDAPKGSSPTSGGLSPWSVVWFLES